MHKLFCTKCGTLAKDFRHRCKGLSTENAPTLNPNNPNFSWAAWRYGGIGASDAPIVMNSTPFGTPYKLWQLKTGRVLPEAPSYPMIQGIKAEPIIRARYEDMVGMEMPRLLAIHPEHDFIRATLDGANRNEGKAAEFKFSGKKDHAKALSGEVPRKYRYQLVQQMLVLGLNEIDYFSYYSPDRQSPERGNGVIVRFRLEKKDAKRLLSENTKFWDCVVTDTPPAKPPSQLFKVRKI